MPQELRKSQGNVRLPGSPCEHPLFSITPLARTLSARDHHARFHTAARIVLTTTSSPEEADRLAHVLVEERLAACATLIPAVQSIYRWQGQVESSTETLLLLKTGLDQLPALEARLHELHSYDTPEFLVLPVESGSAPYLDWLQASLKQPARRCISGSILRLQHVWYSELPAVHALVNDRSSCFAWGAAACSRGRGASHLASTRKAAAPGVFRRTSRLGIPEETDLESEP